ncbi:thiamine pyrophosphate-binding protein [Sulfurospirillum diekertiae]|uniref:Acetolactate synthase large subunit n=1 Tax=Sulfurospirillum diekertiae TaxID=1854492 RepID=A0A290HXE8_9BACT|nr:thiamine pyrophosphate-binding protein [Sulfurospirillum diekertiae]ATB70330.1 Acetolactate synthase large subunit [Sulfurospirillum diekertiae]QIR75394.1 thiamine pyrophosphate-binding protein [Sulfurospirillum diekertiae]QIR78045.1 thiamine pyrophosphate-binding protein [Sulfurospirillum diekertiae]
MKASDYIVQFLVDQGIDKAFGYIGGAVAHLYDSFDKNTGIEIVNTIHEQGAGFAAEGYARVSGKTGVATATSGPGATNLITPIGSCFFDSISTLFITGQVNTYEYKYDTPVRQIGFQETDIVSIVKPITKYAVMIDMIQNLRYELEKAYFLTQNGRKGPVLIDIPMNIQRTDFNPSEQKSFFESDEYKMMRIQGDKIDFEKIVEMLRVSQRPIILVGGGSRLSSLAPEAIHRLLEKSNLPVVYSLMGKDVVKDDYKYNFGLIGSYGNRYSNLALANADLIIVLGSRLDTRQTGTDLKTFARAAKIIHVDIDVNELDSKIKADVTLHCDIADFINTLSHYDFKLNLGQWLEKLVTYKQNYSSTTGIDGKAKVPNQIIQWIAQSSSDHDMICVDVGQHQMWVAQSFETKADQRVLFSGGMGAMGFALPTAIGATIGTKKRALVIVGDGGFQMNIQELEVIKRRNLPIKVFIMNNANLGMVRQFQEIYFEQRYIGTQKDYSVPNFASIANAYGLKSSTISTIEEISQKIHETLLSDEAEIINICLQEQMTTVEPKLIVNKPIEDMYPFLEREEFNAQMIIKPLEH